MALYPGEDQETKVSHTVLQNVVREVFKACGMSREDADLLTDTLVTADLRGIHSHGVLRVPDYAKKLLEDGVNPRGKPRIVKETGAALVVDGDNSMGQIGSAFAMGQAIERARAHGISFVAVQGSNHCGAMSYYTTLALAHDMIGIAATNALPTMAPWGGIDKILGINPLSMAIPANHEHPIVFDAAFSYSSHGKIRVFEQKGLSIPENWAFDAEGHATTDPSKAIPGLLQPIGEYKGTGLALITGILSTLLSEASYGTKLGNLVDGPRPGKDGHFYIAVNISAFVEPQRFKERVDGIIGEIHSSALAPNQDRIYYPGEMEALTEDQYRSEGIPLNSVTLTNIAEVAERLDVDPDLIPWDNRS